MQVQSVNTLDTSVPLYDAYAGFFIAMAWLCEVLGLADPLGLSVMWPVLLGLIRVIVLRYLAGQLLDSPGQCWVAVALAVLADSLGADYFSPQSVAFVLGLAAVGVALSRTLTRHRGLIVLAASVTLAVTHQLSPFIVGGVLVVLVLFGQCRPGWYPLLILGPAILWASLHYQAVLGSLSLETFGRAENFKPPTTTSAPDLERLPVVQNTVLALVAGIVIVGILAAIALARHVRERRYWALACCPAVGLVAVALTPYGQEGIFRAALFGLPWLAIMASDVLSHQFLGSRLMTRVTLAAMTGHLVIAHLVSSFGLDATDVVRQSDLAAVRHFETRGGASPPNLYYLLILNEGDHPTTPELAGTRHFTWSRDFLDEPVTEKRNFNGRREVQKLTDALLNYTQETDREARLFALWSPVGAVYSEAYGIQSMRQSLALRDAFGRSSFWTSQRFGDGTYLFRFVRGKYFGVDR
jgi:hypothetical protein